MVEEFKEILGCPLGGRKPYLFSRFYPSLARISKIVQISAQELDHRKQVENGVVGIPRKYLEVKARILADKGEGIPFIDILTLLIFGGGPLSECGWVGGPGSDRRFSRLS